MESLHQLEHAGIQIYLPFAHIVIADGCLARGIMEMASLHGKTALELARKMNIKKAHIFSLLNLDHICQEKQEEDQAKEYFEQAYDVAQTVNLNYAIQQTSQALHNLSANGSNPPR